MVKRDLITYRPKLLLNIKDEDFILLQDHNLSAILNYLRKEPATINELTKIFHEKGDLKSEATIYRYIKRLINAKLVVKAGKRFTSGKEKIHSETLYSLSAMFFLTNNLDYSIKEKGNAEINKIHHISRCILQPLFESNKGDSKCFDDFINFLNSERIKIITELFEKIDDDIYETLIDSDYKEISSMLEIIGWIGLIKKIDFSKYLDKCFLENQ